MNHPDIDIDFADRNEILKHIDYVRVQMDNGKPHPSGIYVVDAPKEPFSDMASLNLSLMNELGYDKIDILNQSVYGLVKSPEHLEELLQQEIPWHRLKDRKVVEALVHIGSYYDVIQRMEPIDSIEKMAMFLSILRPGKKHLMGLSWKEIRERVWIDEPEYTGYRYKHSHAIAYAHLVCLHLRLVSE